MLASLKSWFISQPNTDYFADYAKNGETPHLNYMVTLFGKHL